MGVWEGSRTGRDGGRVGKKTGKTMPLVGGVSEYGIFYEEATEGGGGRGEKKEGVHFGYYNTWNGRSS